MRRLAAALLATASLLAAACAPKTPLVTMPATPAHPDFVYPAAPPGTAPALVDRLELGWRLVQRDEAAAADREFAAILKTRPGFAPALAGQGFAALARDRAGDAVTHFDQALAASTGYGPALMGRGLALLAADRPDDALAAFEAALAAAPGTPDLAARIETLRLRQSQDRVTRAERAAAAQRWDEARSAYLAAIAASPESAFLYRDLAAVERKAGNPDAALAQARRAVEIDDDDVRAHVLVAQLLADRRDYAGALAAYERAAALEPSPAIEREIGEVRARAREAALPEEFRAIPTRPEVTRGDVAALLGIRLPALLGEAPQRQVVMTDVRNHWATPWIQAAVRAGAMDVFPNYTFQANAVMRRADLADVVFRVLTLLDGGRSTADPPPAAGAAISDVGRDHLAFAAVRRAVDAGILPLEDGAFHLLRPVTGQEAVAAVSRLMALAGVQP